jgi:hypothetical protein
MKRYRWHKPRDRIKWKNQIWLVQWSKGVQEKEDSEQSLDNLMLRLLGRYNCSSWINDRATLPMKRSILPKPWTLNDTKRIDVFKWWFIRKLILVTLQMINYNRTRRLKCIWKKTSFVVKLVQKKICPVFWQTRTVYWRQIGCNSTQRGEGIRFRP